MERTATFLMANLGSDMSQLFSHIDNGELEKAKSPRERANRIIDELLNHPELKGRSGEVEILKKIIQDVFSEKRELKVEKEEIEDYFMPFALRALSENKII